MKIILKIVDTLARRITLVVAVAALSFASVLAMPATPASAASCRDSHPFNAYLDNIYVDNNLQTAMYSGIYTVPSWSSCRDINVSDIYNYQPAQNVCALLRVRFYPRSGGTFVNAWQQRCTLPIGTLKPIATNVADGTSYRIEAMYNRQLVLRVHD